jgi:serine phosphatase RsbU (regulator of sigma subunit)
MGDLPRSVADALFGLVVEQRAAAWLHVDAAGTLTAAGGRLAHWGLEGLRTGEPAGGQLFFVEGFLPLAESPFLVRAMEIVEGRAADLQFYADGDAAWIVLLDVTAERDEARRVQQRAYDMILLQEKEALLNRRLEAANAALRATQADLERSEAALRKAYGLLEAELSEAAAYVRSILPEPMAAPFAADWRFVPSAKLGGDCFGYHWIDDAHFAVYLLDVCGHGVGPSLLSVGALNSIRSGTLPGTDLRDPPSVLAALNEVYQMERHHDLFFTIWYGVYRPADRRLAFAGGGHPPALMLVPGADGGPRVERLQGTGLPMGVMPGGRWARGETAVAAGARLYVISDGTFEVSRPDGAMMELEALEAFLAAQPPADGAADLDRLLAHLRAEHGGDALDDDFSIVRLAF